MISVSHDSTCCGRASYLDILLTCHALLNLCQGGFCDELKRGPTHLPGEDKIDQSRDSRKARGNMQLA